MGGGGRGGVGSFLETYSDPNIGPGLLCKTTIIRH